MSWHNCVTRTTKQVFLTRAIGFIGQSLGRAMRGRGWGIHALVCDNQSAPALPLDSLFNGIFIPHIAHTLKGFNVTAPFLRT
jgi:hypothetical protein